MDRRDLLKGGAAAAIAVPFIATAELGKELKISVAQGQYLTYPVTDGFHERMLARHPDLISMSFDDLNIRAKELLDRSTARQNRLLPRPAEPMSQGGTLTVAERDRLDVITHVINCHNAARELQGRPLSDFGFVGIDQVHGNMRQVTSIGECGCVMVHIFDHAKTQAKLWAMDLVKSEAVIAKLDTMETYTVPDGEKLPESERTKPVPPRSKMMMERLRNRHREGFLHYAGIGGIAHLPPQEVAQIEVPNIPHYARYACDEHLHLWSDPEAHDAAVRADNAGVSASIADAYRLVEQDRIAVEARAKEEEAVA